MDSYTPRIRSLLRQAQRTGSVNKRAATIMLYRQILEESPEIAEAWIGLGRLLTDDAEKERAFNQALALDPENKEALAGLAVLRGEAPPDAETTADQADATARVEEEIHRDPVEGVPVAEQPKVTVTRRAARPRKESQGSQSAGRMTAAPVASLSTEAVAAEAEDVEVEISEQLVCANHPQRRTNLRCNHCGRPICMRCAKPTPVGYRCPQCIREREDVFYNATPLDYVVAAVSALIISSLAAFIVPRLGFFVIFLAAIAGSFIGRLVFRLAGRRRGRWLPHLVAAMIVVGALPAFLIYGGGWIWVALYLFLATGAAYYQMK
jgi:uncharacterized membrane protein YeaQ/YmgE (transglycosylase-associated protein family)